MNKVVETKGAREPTPPGSTDGATKDDKSTDTSRDAGSDSNSNGDRLEEIQERDHPFD